MDVCVEKPKVVFLIDCSLACCQECNHFDETLSAVLRMLYFLEQHQMIGQMKRFCEKDLDLDRSDRSSLRHSGINWGFKFFNTKSTLPRNKVDTSNPSFMHNLKLSNFEDFEKKAKIAFETSLEVKRKSISVPSELLSIALTEVLHDFIWSNQDLDTKRSVADCGTDTISCMNTVIILGKAPKNGKALRWFCNKVVLDSDVFIDSLMSPDLLREYKEKLNISLSWLDFDSHSCSRNGALSMGSTRDGIFIIQEAVRKLGGCFLSKDSILQTFPLESVDTSHIFAGTNFFQVIPQESYMLRLTVTGEHKSIRPVMGLLKGLDDDPVMLIPVCGSESDTEMMSAESSNLQSSRNLRDQNLKKHEKEIQETVMHQPQPAFEFSMVGSISQICAHEFLRILSGPSYIFDCRERKVLSALLNKLRTLETSAVLNVKASGRKKPSLAILSLCTSKMGCISFLSQDSKLKVGKNLFSQKQGSGSQTVSPVGVEETSNSSQTHLHRFKDKLLGLKTPEGEDLFPACGAIQDKLYRSHCLNTWHIPGCLPQVTPFASTINERACKHEHFQSDNNTLKLLRKFYANEKQPYEVIQDTATNTDANVMVLRSYGKEDSSSRPSASDLSRQRSSLLSRGRLMVDRAKSTGSSVSEDQERSLCGKSVSPERRTSNSFGLADINLKTEEDLQSYLVKQYDQVVSAGIAVETTTQAMLTVTSRFMADNLHSNPQKSTVHFVRKHLVLTAPQLKEKYEKKTSEENVQNKIAEYKLQIMLLLEMESLLLEHDTSAMEKLTSELVCMLRGVSFLIGATNLRDFLTNVIVANYVTNLPKVLLDIFDELMLPLPQTLAKFASPSAPSSVWGAPLSSAEESLLSAPGSSQPPSNFSDQNSQHAKRSARFIQHPSISDFRQKRQILVDKPKSKPESKANAKDKVRAKLRSSRKKPGVDCNRAKRNLFSEKKPCKSRSKSRTLLTPRQRRRHHSTQGTEKSKLLVPETPSHKQTSKRMLRRQELKRRRDNIKPEVQVVAESPVKEDDEPPALMNKPARYVVRESFYSSNSQPSRHVVRSIELSQKDSGHRSSSQSQSFIRSSQRSQGSLASAVRGDDPLLSPRSSLVKSFLSSPSPEPKSRHTQKHCSTPTRRRSKTKSMTKLDFRSEHGRKDTHSSTTSNKVDAQMIFDGENASDFNLLTSPLKRITSELPEAGFVTPVKQTPLSRLDLLSSVSCPPLLATPPKKTPGSSSSSRLSFRNILSQETNTGLESDGPSACPVGTLGSDIKRISCTSAVAQDDGHPVGQKVVSRNYKAKEKLCEDGNKAVIEHYTRATFSCTDEEVAKHHSSFSKSPKKKNDNASRHWQNSSPSQKRRKNAERSKLNACSNSPKSGKKTLQIIDSGLEEVGVEDDDQIVFSTPQKGFPGKAIPSHFTPSKVTFSKHALISPPTGTGYPPSAEKSTPTKSILKKSPMVKARPVRRVDLKSVTCSNLLDKLKAASLSPEKDGRFHDISSHSRTESNDIPSHSQAESNASAQSVETARQSLHTANVLGNEVPSKDAKANTTILIHTKSPVTKSKTPDSINKWMRKKHHSGSKSSSSSSSGSILSLSFSSPSNDSKSKMSSTSPGTLEGKENAESSHQDLGSCMGNSSASFIKPSRKRNIFSVEETLPTEHHRKISKKRSRSKHEEQKSKKLRLDRMESHAFSPSTNLEIASPDGEGSTSTWSMQFNTRPPSDKNVFSLSTRSQGMSPNSSFSDSSANGAIRQSYILPSGLSEDSSQGFQVQSLAQNPSGEPSTAHTLPDGNSSHRTSHTTVGTVEVPLAADLMKHSSSTSGNSNGSPTQLKFSSDTLTNKQYSPALSANGLLQLIKSPLVPLESRRRTKDQGETVRTRTKSRKHLDLK